MSSELFRTDLHDPVLILSAAADLTTEQPGYEASYATRQPPVVPADTETTQGSVERCVYMYIVVVRQAAWRDAGRVIVSHHADTETTQGSVERWR